MRLSALGGAVHPCATHWWWHEEVRSHLVRGSIRRVRPGPGWVVLTPRELAGRYARLRGCFLGSRLQAANFVVAHGVVDEADQLAGNGDPCDAAPAAAFEVTVVVGVEV